MGRLYFRAYGYNANPTVDGGFATVTGSVGVQVYGTLLVTLCACGSAPCRNGTLVPQNSCTKLNDLCTGAPLANIIISGSPSAWNVSEYGQADLNCTSSIIRSGLAACGVCSSLSTVVSCTNQCGSGVTSGASSSSSSSSNTAGGNSSGAETLSSIMHWIYTHSLLWISLDR